MVTKVAAVPDNVQKIIRTGTNDGTPGGGCPQCKAEPKQQLGDVTGYTCVDGCDVVTVRFICQKCKHAYDVAYVRRRQTVIYHEAGHA